MFYLWTLKNPSYNIRCNNQLKKSFCFFFLDANIKINTTTHKRNMKSNKPKKYF